VQHTVATVNDSVDEPNGAVTVTLQAGSGYTVSTSQGTASVTVADNDAAPVEPPAVEEDEEEEDDPAAICQSAPTGTSPPIRGPYGRLRARAIARDRLTLSWFGATRRTPPPAGYVVFSWEPSEGDQAQKQCAWTPVLPFTLTGLSTGTEYALQVVMVYDGVAHSRNGSAVLQVTTQTWPLIQAVRDSDRAEVQRLLRAGAAVDAQDGDGQSALHEAVRWNMNAIVGDLLGAGADPDLRDEDGWTPLHMAAYWGVPQMVQALLQAGADASLEDDAGRTALAVAQEIPAHGTPNTAVVRLLQAAAE